MKSIEKETENITLARKGKMRLGEMLVERGIINYTQLNEALSVQRKKGDRLAGILVELGIMSEDGIADFYSGNVGVRP
ncbi:MAG: hypothetical protein AB1414_16140 [bacterium]